jgi:hypothetical protein
MEAGRSSAMSGTVGPRERETMAMARAMTARERRIRGPLKPSLAAAIIGDWGFVEVVGAGNGTAACAVVSRDQDTRKGRFSVLFFLSKLREICIIPIDRINKDRK